VYTPNGITEVRAGLVVERSLHRLTDRFIAVSPSEAQLAARRGLATPDKIVVIPNAIEPGLPKAIDLRGLLGIAADTPLVGTIGRLVPQKAPAVFVEACALIARSVPDARFVLIGGGALAAEVDDAVERAGLNGAFSRIEQLPGAAGALGDLDVFALSSIFEGGPYAPLEAMRAGTAVVLTDVTGNRDAVEHGISGLLVPPADPDALSGAVVALLQDSELRHRLAQRGRDRVRDSFDVTVMGGRLADLYRELSSSRA
jgi:glycosyltransferase involved in cell wall biosynthesis